jgi:LacI family transcriptional regulator
MAGVSIATVSRVINDNYYVSRLIRERVLEAIEKLDYHPNYAARSLKGASSLTVGFLVSDISNSYFNIMAKAIEVAIRVGNYNLLVCSTENERERELSFIKTLVGKRIDGLIINTTGLNDGLIAEVSRRLPVALVHRRLRSRGYRGDFVDSDNRRGGYLLTRHLLDHGHRRIGVINGLLSVSSGRERFEGFSEAMKEFDIPVGKSYPYAFPGDFTDQSGYDGLNRLWQSADRPTAIVVMNNVMAVGSLRYALEHGIEIPGELSLTAFGNIVNRDIFYVHPTVVSLDPIWMGTTVGALILERIQAPDLPNRESIFKPELVPGNSAAPARLDIPIS